MSEEITQNIPDGRSFEARVFARLDSIDSRFDSIDGRLQSLENQAERRALETKPIWERALAEILEVKDEILEVKDEILQVKDEILQVKERLGSLEQLSNQIVRKIDVLGKDMLTLRADQAGVENRLDKLESNPVS